MKIVRFHNLTHLSTEFIREVVHKTTLSQMKTEKPLEEWFTHWHKESFTIYRKGKQISPMQLLQSLLSAIQPEGAIKHNMGIRVAGHMLSDKLIDLHGGDAVTYKMIANIFANK